MREQPLFLPLSQEEAKRLGIEQFDVILISGDAYVDHPSFGTAIIGRSLWDAGYSVGIIDQPDWRRNEDFLRLGSPRLFFGVTSGNVDSMVNHFTPNLKRRSSDVYSPGGILRRPDRAAIVYADRLHALFPGVPIVLGGIESSLRRFAHYDYWSDSVRRSILADAPADLLVYGMGERALKEAALRLAKGEAVSDIRDVAGTTFKDEVRAWKSSKGNGREESVLLPDFGAVSSDKRKYAQAFALHYQEQDPFSGKAVVQAHPKTVIVQNPPARPLASEELDHIYELPFTRDAHPSYRQRIPALEPVRFSITSHRGCFGSCSFCALTHHQGRIVQSRSIDSIVREAAGLTEMKGFKGIIQDVGGATANMYGMTCARWKQGACTDKPCSANCPSLNKDHARQVEMLRRLRAIPGVKKIFISSGIRHDLILEDGKDSADYLREVCQHHVSGHLKIAPEHISDNVTECMHKPPKEVLDAFSERFLAATKEVGKEQYLLPYLMSGHPGCSVEDMIELAEYLRDRHMYTEQVQDFTPTPMTVSTAMYYTGLDPFTLKPVHVPKGREKRIQRAILQYRDPKSYSLVLEGLKMAGRMDLVGAGRKCLTPWRSGSLADEGQKRKKERMTEKKGRKGKDGK